MENRENIILQLALEALKKNVHLEVREVRAEEQTRDHRIDYLLRMEMRGKEIHYYAEIKRNVTMAGRLLLQLRKMNEKQKMLLVTTYVNPQMADELKNNGQEFIDTVGNAYIDQPDIYIFVRGNKPPENAIPIPGKGVFKPTGLKVIYAFLCNAGLENKPYRDIAIKANVALGTVGWVMRELKGQGYILDMGKRGNKILKRETLLQRWVEAYPERLKPKLVLGRFQGNKGWWEHVNLQPDIALWGGEVAAAKLTNYLKPQIITLYTTEQEQNNLLLKNRLKKDPKGNVEIVRRFWGPGDEFQREDMVHPILVYADLIATGDQRNKETARMIYEKHIAGLVREN